MIVDSATGLRRFIAGMLATALPTATAIFAATAPAHAASNPIVVENQQQGSSGWQIDGTSSDDINKQIEGYADATSVNVGGTINFYITVNPVQTYTIDIYRMGYYQGLGGRLMQSIGPLNGVTQASCPMDSTTGMIACNWQQSFSLSVPTTWTSGVFLAKLTNAHNFEHYVVFTVRDDNRQAALLYQQSVTTYQAYNNWPDDPPSGSSTPATGKSLYEGSSSSTVTGVGTTRAVKVSFDRPYAGDDGAGDFFEWEFYYLRWLEQSGYDVAYSTNVDTHTNGQRLRSYSGFLSVGHDEYWSRPMRDAVTGARDSGVGLGFFGANEAYWQIRFESNAGGAANRVEVCYKDAKLDPVQDSTVTVRWRDAPVSQPEQSLVGVMFTSEQPDGAGPASFVAQNTSNSVYSGTGMSDGDSVPGIIGYEADHYFSTVPSPATVPGTYVLLSNSPYQKFGGGTDVQNSSIYQAPSGAWVFGAGSIEWSWGLYNDSAEHHADARIQKITANVLSKFLSAPNPPPAAPSGFTATPSSGSISLTWNDNATNENNYVIDRSTTSNFSSVTTVTLPANTTSYTDNAASPGNVYYYRVQAVNGGGGSPYSTAAAATAAYADLVKGRNGVISYWRLGESVGTSALDSVGTNDGTYLNGVSLGAAGAIARDPDTAVGMNGSNNKVSLPGLASVTDFTIEGWTKLGSGATNNSNGNNALYGTQGNVRLLARPGTPASATAAYGGVWLGGTEYVLQPSSLASNIGSWVQWVLTRQGATLTLYRNGVMIAQRTDLPASAAANISGWIGAQGGSAYFLNGSIDDVSVYSAALSASQVSDDYVAATNGLAPSASSGTSYRDTVLGEQGLLSYWRLDESSGTTATDIFGHNNGTYSGGFTLGASGAVRNDPDTAVGLNGTSGKISLPALSAVTDFTIEGWTNLGSGATNNTNGNNALYATQGNVRLLARPGTPNTPTAAYAGVWLGGTEYVLQPNSAQSNLGSWVQWVLTRSGGTLTLYRNGVRIAQRTDLPAATTANISGWIGAQTGNAYFLNGAVDDVSVYTRALSASAVANHYNAAISGPAPS